MPCAPASAVLQKPVEQTLILLDVPAPPLGHHFQSLMDISRESATLPLSRRAAVFVFGRIRYFRWTLVKPCVENADTNPRGVSTKPVHLLLQASIVSL